MAGEWQTARIEEVAERVAMGPFGSSIKVETFVSEGVPVISGQHLHGSRVDDKPGFNFITQEHAEKLRNANVQRGDVIFTHAGNIGQVAYIPPTSVYKRYVISQRQFFLRPDFTKVLPEILVAYFRSPEGRHKLLANTSQVGVPSIAHPVTYLRSLEIPLPPLPEQRAIAHILGTLDDKIENLRKQNETLEAMARALFKAWFVDFEPVRAKIEGRWQGGQSLPGLPAHLYDLFPDRLVESELGEIPEGWEAGTLANVATLNPEVWSKQTRPPEIHYVDLSNTKWGRIEITKTYPADNAPSRAQRVLRPGDTIIGTVRPGNGSYAFISDEGLTGSTGFAVLRPIKPQFAQFVYLASTARENIDALAHLADGGAYPAVRPEVVAATPTVLPGDAVLGQFALDSSSMLEKMVQNERESRTLAQLRDTLLPRLISGELRVKDAEAFLQERGL